MKRRVATSRCCYWPICSSQMRSRVCSTVTTAPWLSCSWTRARTSSTRSRAVRCSPAGPAEQHDAGSGRAGQREQRPEVVSAVTTIRPSALAWASTSSSVAPPRPRSVMCTASWPTSMRMRARSRWSDSSMSSFTRVAEAWPGRPWPPRTATPAGRRRPRVAESRARSRRARRRLREMERHPARLIADRQRWTPTTSSIPSNARRDRAASQSAEDVLGRLDGSDEPVRIETLLVVAAQLRRRSSASADGVSGSVR
jgi:hypothetical protein